jgi:hypothetical protein
MRGGQSMRMARDAGEVARTFATPSLSAPHRAHPGGGGGVLVYCTPTGR